MKFSFRYRRIDMPKKSEGGWSGIGMANSGIDPTHVYFLNDHPTQIPPSEILGPVVQNCRPISTPATPISAVLLPVLNMCLFVRARAIVGVLLIV